VLWYLRPPTANRSATVYRQELVGVEKPAEASSAIPCGGRGGRATVIGLRAPRKTSEGPSACVLIDSYYEAGSCRTLLLRLLPAETVEFSVSCASEESMPFVRCKSENRPCGIPAVAYTDLATG
jgi:hypothetical protein